MRYRTAFFIATMCIGLSPAFAQVTLDQVLSKARSTAPEYAVKSLIARQADLQSANINTQRLPQFAVTGQATYQSDVTSVGIDLPGVMIEPPPEFQYKAQAEVNQVLYDGGRVAHQKHASEIANGVESAQAVIEINTACRNLYGE